MEHSAVTVHLMRHKGDTLKQYLNDRPPTVITNNRGEEIIIPPLNTDIRFDLNYKRPNAHNLAYSRSRGDANIKET